MIFKITYKDGPIIRKTRVNCHDSANITDAIRRFYKYHDYSAVIYDIFPTVLPDYPQ